MLRECSRVLKKGGRIAGYVIHTPTGLSPSDGIRAAVLGPSDIGSLVPIEELTYSAGLNVIAHTDVTDVFRATCKAFLEAREELEDELRAEGGDEIYEEEQEKKLSMLTGIDEGLLLRSLIVSKK